MRVGSVENPCKIICVLTKKRDRHSDSVLRELSIEGSGAPSPRKTRTGSSSAGTRVELCTRVSTGVVLGTLYRRFDILIILGHTFDRNRAKFSLVNVDEYKGQLISDGPG